MAFVKVLLCVFLSLFQFIHGNVPVLIWGSKTSDQVNTFSAFHSLSKNEFLQYFLKKVHGENPLPLILVFSEESLSMEDFSGQDSQGQGYFPKIRNIFENAANAEFLPLVQDPMGAVNQLTNYGYSLIPIDSNNKYDLPDGCGKILIIKLPEAKPKEDRSDLLRRHDVKISEVYSELLEKCRRVIGVMSGQQPSWLDPEKEGLKRLGRSPNDSPDSGSNNSKAKSFTLFQDTDGISMLYSSTLPRLIIDGNNISLQNLSLEVSGDNSEFRKINLYVNYGDKYNLSFNFDNITNGYWYLRSVDLTIFEGEKKKYILVCTHDIYAPLGMSYHCGYPVIFRNITTEGKKSLVKEFIFSDIQVEPFFFKEGSKSFSEAMDEVPYFTPAIWSGLLVMFILMLIFTWGLCMLMDIKTNDRFEDPKGPTINISVND